MSAVPPIALSYRDAAAACGLTYGSLRTLICRGGGLRTTALGTHSRVIRITDIETWLAAKAGHEPVAPPRPRGRPRKAPIAP